jgi:hypothetical protein
MREQEFSTIEDFVFNSSFREWLLKNNADHKAYWEKYIKEHPEKAQLVNYAKAIVYALTVTHKQLSNQEVDKEIQAILSKTNSGEISAEEFSTSRMLGKPRKYFYTKLAVAAAFIGLGVFSISYFAGQSSKQNAQADLFKPQTASSSSTVIEQINNSDTIQMLTLFDGSKVQLNPKSRLTFSQGSFNKKREVYLSGEAFFNVQKNPSVPFVVYTENLITKVLGTSFNVKAYSFEKKATVQVKTGKVSVYKKENFSDKKNVSNSVDGVIVIPNQQVIYDFVNNQLRKTIIDQPVILTESTTGFVFNSTPLKDVFNILQNTYGIAIIYDESVINSCSLSASMGSESFYEKLELICKAINASYESIDGTIYISSQGCK